MEEERNPEIRGLAPDKAPAIDADEFEASFGESLARVAILVDEAEARDAWLAANGWLARPYHAWSVPDLLAALEERV